MRSQPPRLSIFELDPTADASGLRVAHEATLSIRPTERLRSLIHIDDRSMLVCVKTDWRLSKTDKILFY